MSDNATMKPCAYIDYRMMKAAIDALSGVALWLKNEEGRTVGRPIDEDMAFEGLCKLLEELSGFRVTMRPISEYQMRDRTKE